MLLTRRTHRTQQIHTRTTAGGPSPCPFQTPSRNPRENPSSRARLPPEPAPAHLSQDHGNGWEGRSATGEAGKLRKSAPGAGWAHGVCSGERGSGNSRFSCSGLQAQRGAPESTSLSFSKWETLGAKVPPAGAPAPRATVPIPKGLCPTLSPHQQQRGLADTCAGPGGVGVPAQPPATLTTPATNVSGVLSLTAEPQGRGGTKVGCGGAKPAPAGAAWPGSVLDNKGSDYLALESSPGGSWRSFRAEDSIHGRDHWSVSTLQLV